MHQDLAAQRDFGIEDRRQLLVLDLDHACGLLGCRARIGRNRDDLLADEAHAVDGQHRHVLEAAAPASEGEVTPGEDDAYAGDRLRAARVDAEDPRVRDGTAHEGAPQQIGQALVRPEARSPGDLELCLRSARPKRRLKPSPCCPGC